MAGALPESGPSAGAAAAANPAYAFAAALFDELARGGVRECCVCPGSRSAPLAVAAARTPGLRVRAHWDERSAAFFALGVGLATGAPAAVVTTSGTAAANLHPAAAEAAAAGVPLLLLTADRPPEARGWGAPQTIDQVHLFGRHARWYAEPPLPEEGEASLRHARALGARAVAQALATPPGPVHLNLPFREPLEPGAEGPALPAASDEPASPAARGRAEGPWRRALPRAPAPDPEAVEPLAEAVAGARSGVLVAGPGRPDAALAEAAADFARAAGWPVFAEATSPLRTGPQVRGARVLGAADAFLRDAATARALAPDCVLRLGGPPTSRALRDWLARSAERARLVVLDAAGGGRDPEHAAWGVVEADPAATLRLLARRLREGPRRAPDPRLAARAEAADARARTALEAATRAAPELLPPHVVAALADALPEESALFVASSLAVRDLDLFLPVSERRLRVHANRGASGIDGTLSSALGVAAGQGAPVALLTGDLAFLHDAGALWAARRHGIPVTAVVVNDEGGGIFAHLPIAACGEAVRFEELFVVPHGADVGALARAWGAEHARVESEGELRRALREGFERPGARVLEVRVDRETARAQRAAALEAAARAARGEGRP